MGAPAAEFSYTKGLLAGIAARTIRRWDWPRVWEEAGREALTPGAGEAPPDFDVRARLALCADEDRAPDALEKAHFAEYGLDYLGPEIDGFVLHVGLPAGQMCAADLRALAAICQQVANGSVQLDVGGGLSLRVVSVRDAPAAVAQIEAAGWRAGRPPVCVVRGEDAGGVPVPGGRLLSAQMDALAGLLDAQGTAAAVHGSSMHGLYLSGCVDSDAAIRQARQILTCFSASQP